MQAILSLATIFFLGELKPFSFLKKKG